MTTVSSVIGRRSTTDAGLLAGSVAVLAWGFGPLMVAAVDASTPTIVAYRLTLAIPVMLAVARATGGGVDLTMLRRATGPGILFGASLFAAFGSFSTTSIANSTLIPAMTPVLVMFVAGRMFGERLQRRQLLFVAVALAGIVLVVFSADSSSGATLGGDLLAVIDLVLFTAYLLWVKKERDAGAHSWSFVAAVFVVASAVVVPICLVISDDLGAIRGWDLGLIVLMVVGPGLIGHGLMTWAQRHLDITIASLLTLASPVISAIGAWLLLSQRLGPTQIVGAVLVLSALGGIALGARTPALVESGLSAPPE